MPGHCCVQACSSGEWPGNRGWFQPAVTAVQLPTGLGSVWAFVNPIINEVPKVNAVLVLQYHVVENTARVQDVSYLKNVMAWQWNL
jgi:hypothetical protein